MATVEARAFCKTVLPHLLADHVLPYCSLGRLYALCKATAARRVCLHERCVRWLLEMTSFVPSAYAPAYIFLRPEEVLWEYQASLLQATFLRTVSGQLPNTIIAGGFALAHALHNMRLASFHANDVDIFVSSEAVADAVLDCYEAEVVRPMGLATHKTCTTFSRRGEPMVDVLADTTGGVDSDSSHDAGLWDLGALRIAVQDWLEFHFDDVVHHPDMDVDERRKRLDCLDALRALSRHLPAAVRRQEYQVELSYHRRPYLPKSLPHEHARSPSFLPLGLRTLNVILVARPSGDDASRDFASFICGNFDITACRCSLRVGPDLSCSVSGFGDALGDAHARRLKLTAAAFSCSTETVNYQMTRILKYAMRDFHLDVADGDGFQRFHSCALDQHLSDLRGTFRDLDLTHGYGAAEVGAAHVPHAATEAAIASTDSTAGRSAVDAMRAHRVAAARSGYAGYDFWIQCQLGDEKGDDPILQQLAESL